jgi:hypothetical protein
LRAAVRAGYGLPFHLHPFLSIDEISPIDRNA